MGLLDMFKKDNSDKPEKKLVPWIALTEQNQLKTIKENSKQKTQIIFKHSTRCGISKMVANQFQSSYDYDDTVDAYYLDLLNYKPLSAEIAAVFQVMHQSPQLIVIKNGTVVHHASHHEIHAANIEQFV